MNRRSLLKLLSTIPLLSFFGTFAYAQKKEDNKAKLLDENDPLAKAMQYKHDASKSPARTDKKAFCYNCAKYNVCMEGDTACKPLDAKALKTATSAPCQIFKGANVAKDGWCLSWQAKA